MLPKSPAKAWLLLAAGEDRQYGGNAGYDDAADAYYSWDDTVKNYGNIRAGDRVALWDKKRLLGVSVVEAIETSEAIKLVHRCPNPDCNKTNISERTSLSPQFKCQRCKHEFDRPVTSLRDVTRYVSRHDAAWTPLFGLLDADELRSACLSPRSIHSMRELDWARFSDLLRRRGAATAVDRMGLRSPDLAYPDETGHAVEFVHGHTTALVRVRRGQQKFRENLLRTFGRTCAFTGAAPVRVLDAGHLYSYAKLGEHHKHGGLLLRRDIHRLFDDGGLAIEPRRLTIDVSEELRNYPQYGELQGRRPAVQLSDSRLGWLEKHWAEHR